MILWHWTPREKWQTYIRWQGLFPCCAKGKMSAVWFSTLAQLPLARVWVSLRQKTSPENLLLLRVKMARSELRNYRRMGLWFTTAHVCPSRIRAVPVPWESEALTLTDDRDALAALGEMIGGTRQ